MDSWGSWSFSIDGQNMLKISYDSRNDMYVPRDNLESNDHGEFVLVILSLENLLYLIQPF